jgi:hypothetical protein
MPNGGDEDNGMSVWEFQPGPSACEECTAAAGYYPDPPERPHDLCNCEISEVAVTGASESWLEIGELRIEEDTYQEEHVTTIDNCGGEAGPTPVSIFAGPVPTDFGAMPLELWDEGVDAAALAQGWTRPETATEYHVSSVPADSTVELTITYTVYTAMFAGQATRHTIGADENGAETDDVTTESVGGFFSTGIAIDVDEQANPCTAGGSGLDDGVEEGDFGDPWRIPA